MATYEEIYGKRVKEFDSDPTLDSSYEGQVWYNSATSTLKSVVAVQAWISSSPLVGAARSNVGSSGTQTASLSLGGSVSSPGYTNAVEEYNGSGWSTSTNYPLSTDGTGVAGTQTSAVAFGGNTHPPSVDRTETFEYDGSSWTSGGALPAGRRGLNNSGFGSQTAAVLRTCKKQLIKILCEKTPTIQCRSLNRIDKRVYNLVVLEKSDLLRRRTNGKSRNSLWSTSYWFGGKRC